MKLRTLAKTILFNPMKFSFGKAAAVVAGFLALFSCVKMELAPEVQESVCGAPVFTAYVDGADSKAVLDGKISKWNGEEWIQVVGRNGNYWFGANTQSATYASFTYNGSNGSYNETDVLAVYPAGGSAYAKNFNDMSVSGVSIPSNQIAVEGSYDPNAAVAVAYTSNTTLNFRNAVALLKFTMGSPDVKNVTVWGDMSEVEVESEAVQADNIYLTVHDGWKSDNAWFAAYFWGNSGNKWEKMTLVSGNMYSCPKTAAYPNVIFCRMNKDKTTTDWDSKWNQTVDLKYGSNNHFTITKPWDGKDGKAEGTWSSYTPTETTMVPLGISGTGTVSYNGGDPQVSGYTNGYVSLNGDFKQGKTYYIAVAPVVFEKGFTVEFSNVGDYDKHAVKSTDKKVAFKRNTIYDLGTIFSGKETGFFTNPAVPDADQPCTIYYRPAEGDDLYGQTENLYVHTWLKNGTSDSHGPTWGTNIEKYLLTKVEDGLWSMTMTPTIREWFNEVSPIGTTPVQRIGIVARTADAKKQTEDRFINVVDSKYGIYMPDGVSHGINYIDNSTVTLVLYDRDNAGRSHDFCNLLWDENWWGYKDKPKKPLHYDSESGCWWITLTGLNPDKQYKFQYQLGYGENVTVTTFDPYTEIVYDRHNDQWISSDTYPGLSAEYGDTHAGRDNGFVSAFKINKDIYDWKVKDFKIEDKNDLVIYELLVRDFTDNAYGEGSIKAALGHLDYLSTLGINAIELMPIQEFDGNDSWGYGNHAYFALDKAYGTRKDYKDFIDACHQRGIAVLVDVVYNHATGAHPYAAMYWDGDKTATNNPWFNQYAPHQWSVYHDWNHSNPMVRDHVKRSLEYMLKEYKVDGFRFDLTKGFTQRGDTDSGYDDSRVGYLKEYNYHIQCVNPHAVMICEHFVDDENYELGKEGIKVWRNMNHSYTKAQKRDMSQADFTGVTNSYNGDSGMMNDWQHFGNLVGFMESHDEQRTNYEAQWSYDGSEMPFATRIARAKANAAFFLLVPGPKMIWQFGEIGYDISIEDNGRTGKKPCKTAEYMGVPERKALYDTYSKLLAFRKKNPRFFDSDVNFRWYVDGSHQSGRYLFAKDGDGKMMAVFGNFGTGTQSIGVSLPSSGPWYQYDNSSAVWNGKDHTVKMAEGEFYVLVSDRSCCL